MSDPVTSQDVVLKIRLPGDLRWAMQRRALEDGGWSFQDFIVAAFRAYLADPGVADAIRSHMLASIHSPVVGSLPTADIGLP